MSAVRHRGADRRGPPAGGAATHPPAFESAFGVFDYLGPVGDALRGGKYHGRPEAMPALGALLRASLPTALRLDPPKVVVPVPLHLARLRRRPLDVPRFLATSVARGLGARIAPRALTRIRDTRPQAGLCEADRWVNVADAFAPGRRGVPADVLLVDDVATTGATLRAAAQTLAGAGAGRIRVLTLAVSDRMA
jgi:predicted amidophosphoribosyltransferase